MSKPIVKMKTAAVTTRDYTGLTGGMSELLAAARRASARTLNAFMTATYWEVGRRIVEFEQGGEKRAEYGEEVLSRLADDLTAQFGRGFSGFNLGRFRMFYLACPADQKRATPSLESPAEISPTPSGISEAASRIFQTSSGKSTEPLFNLADLARAFPLPWSHYVLLIRTKHCPCRLHFTFK